MVTPRASRLVAPCLLALPCTLLLAACGGSTGAESAWSTRAYVYGSVATADGAPAAGYLVTALATAAPSCAESDFSAAPAGGSIYVPVDARGRYRALVVAASAPFTGCVRVDVVANGTTSPVLTSARGATVPFSTQNSAGAYDSVRVDLALP